MDPFAKELLERSRDAHDPRDEDRARVRQKLAARLVVSAGVATAFKATGAGLAGSTKLVLVGAVTLAIGGAIWELSSTSPNPSPPMTVSAVSAAPSSLPAPRAESPPTPVVAASTAALVSASPATARPSSPARQKPPIDAGAADDIEAETALVAAAQSAIGRGDHEAALLELDEHERRFPHGALTDARDAARVVALCGAGRTQEASALRDSFLERYPTSRLAPRVRRACSGSP